MILRLIIFVPRFAEIWGRTSLSGSARALYRALVRPEGRAFFSEYGEPAKLCQSKSATTSSARFISTSDADKPPQKCNSRYRGLLAAKVHWTFTYRSRGLETFAISAPLQCQKTCLTIPINELINHKKGLSHHLTLTNHSYKIRM